MSNFKVDRLRMRSAVTVGEFINLLEGDFLATRSVLAKFAADSDGKYLVYEDGLQEVDKLSIDAMYEEAQKLYRRLEETAVPL